MCLLLQMDALYLPMQKNSMDTFAIKNYSRISRTMAALKIHHFYITEQYLCFDRGQVSVLGKSGKVLFSFGVEE